jgi:hypothetical protein
MLYVYPQLHQKKTKSDLLNQNTSLAITSVTRHLSSCQLTKENKVTGMIADIHLMRSLFEYLSQ